VNNQQARITREGNVCMRARMLHAHNGIDILRVRARARVCVRVSRKCVVPLMIYLTACLFGSRN